jgi:hypothetical protein
VRTHGAAQSAWWSGMAGIVSSAERANVQLAQRIFRRRLVGGAVAQPHRPQPSRWICTQSAVAGNAAFERSFPRVPRTAARALK